MKSKTGMALLTGVATVSFFTLFILQVTAMERPTERTIVIHQKVATSSFFSAPISFDTAKGNANMAIYRGEGSFGNFTGEGVSQSEILFGQSCTMPDGTAGTKLVLVGHVASTRFERTGDLLFERGGPGAMTACLDFATATFHETGEVDIIGGTGAFAGAKGKETVIQDGTVIFNGDGTKTIGAFGFSKGSFVATFTVPK